MKLNTDNPKHMYDDNEYEYNARSISRTFDNVLKPNIIANNTGSVELETDKHFYKCEECAAGF